VREGRGPICARILMVRTTAEKVEWNLRRIAADRQKPTLRHGRTTVRRMRIGDRPPSPNGRRRRMYVFRIVLSCSRKAYSEAVYRQTTEDFIACLENTFQHFGGMTRTDVIDNLSAAVKQPDRYHPELNPRLEAFCQHYGIVILPTKSYTPRHKGRACLLSAASRILR